MTNEVNSPKWVTATDIAKMFGIAKNGVFRMAKRGEFPKPLKLGHNRRWSAQEVSEWIEAQKKESAINA